jgi:hypothetical protein
MMAVQVERLADEAAQLAPADFTDFCRRLAAKRRAQALPGDITEELLRAEELAISQQNLTEDWQDVPDDWDASTCRSTGPK